MAATLSTAQLAAAVAARNDARKVIAAIDSAIGEKADIANLQTQVTALTASLGALDTAIP